MEKESVCRTTTIFIDDFGEPLYGLAPEEEDREPEECCMAGFDITLDPAEAASLLGACKQEYSWDKESQVCLLTSKSVGGIEDIYSFPDKNLCCLEFSKVENLVPSTI